MLTILNICSEFQIGCVLLLESWQNQIQQAMVREGKKLMWLLTDLQLQKQLAG